jgi:TonB dependent receptor/TonB-dependent Receptor Plug Domain/CarboxypepD_reg-like domain
MRIFLLFIGVLSAKLSFSQTSPVFGTIVDAGTNQPLEAVTIYLLPQKIAGATDAHGKFIFKQAGGNASGIIISSVGYEIKTLSLQELAAQKNIIALNAQKIELSSVTVSPRAGDQFRPISKMDIALRGVTNSQEVLRIVPGLFIGQHQGGGKSEQIFLRGFDCDHGTDISLNVDGMPINMVSHAHGQGYADSHSIIPETIEEVNFRKGPYYAEKGDFCTTGYVDFHTRNALTNNELKLEAGMFNTFRAIGMFNLLNERARAKQQSWYTASEYRYSDGYFDNPQHFNRFNFFTKYNGRITDHTSLIVSASVLNSKWNASGQIPDRAVSEGLIGFYGALDPNEGGSTSRTNVNAQLFTSLPGGDLFKNQLYYTFYTFDLHSNFTFFLVDSVNGDEIRQKESRNLFGYKGSYEHIGYEGSTKLSTEAGIDVRADATNHSGLSYTKDRFLNLQQLKFGNITEFNAAAYLSETIRFNEQFSINAGLRFDQFYNKYNNKLASDSMLHGIGIYKANDNIFSPKLSLYYHPNEKAEFYFSTGRGFHSNDTRVVVAKNGTEILPPAYGADLGAVFKPAKNIFINAAIWYIYLQQEFVYGGDGGTVDFSGRTRRFGFDFTGRYQPVQSLYFNADINYAHGRSMDDRKGQNYIPLAPIWSSTGGITYTNKSGINGSIRYRYLADRPANSIYSLEALGYFINDLVLNYTKSKYEIGLTISNIFNTKWKETQFDTETRLKGEAHPVDEICFTPGTPFAAKISLSLFFK